MISRNVPCHRSKKLNTASSPSAFVVDIFYVSQKTSSPKKLAKRKTKGICHEAKEMAKFMRRLVVAARAEGTFQPEGC